MATKPGSNEPKPGNTKLKLRGLEPGEERPNIEVSALDREGRCLAAVSVGDDDAFNLPADALKKAHRVRVGPAGDESEDASSLTFLTYRVADFEKVLETGTLNVGRKVWEGWFHLYRCVSGTVSRCRRSPWWYTEIARAAQLPLISSCRVSTALQTVSATASISADYNLDRLIAWPARCSRICLGTVEVYRRICCCEPWVIWDPRFDELLKELEDLVHGIPEIPDIPFPPGPGPDPAPYTNMYIQEGALDEPKLRARQDLQALRSLSAEQVVEYINARPYLICRSYSCGSPVKVAEGTIGPDGRFNICWSEFPRLLVVGCYEEYAYKVKQKIGPFEITIYNGVATGDWYDYDDEAGLKSYHRWAIACRDNGGPGDPFVYLDEIGDTDSSLLNTPDQDSASSVMTPPANGGVAFPTGGPAGNGSHDRNWGGTLKLAIMFSESMRTIGAKYYRVSVTEADANGDPVVGEIPQPVITVPAWNKAVAVPGGVDVVPVSLGPNSTAAPDVPRDSLYEIPYDGDLGTSADWESDQYHMHLDTTLWNDPVPPGAPDPVQNAGFPTKRHLVTIEVFNATGQRLRPNGTPYSGLDGIAPPAGMEIEAGFTFRRKINDTGPTNMVPFGALSHLFWWDNRDTVSKIEDLRMDGLKSDEQCQFLNGTNDSTFGIGYRAYHPWELFQRNHRIWWKRGLSGGSDFLQTPISVNVGVPPAAEGASPTQTFGHMLNHPVPTPPPPPRTKCAFTVFLRTTNKRTDGDNLSYSHAHDSAAFAMDVAPLVCPPCGDEDED